MSTKNNVFEDVIFTCPHCKICCIKLSAEEHALVEAGQLMLEVCAVCGKEVYLNGSNQ